MGRRQAVAGHQFVSYGAHSDRHRHRLSTDVKCYTTHKAKLIASILIMIIVGRSYPNDYMTVAAALGTDIEDIGKLIQRLEECFAAFRKQRRQDTRELSDNKHDRL